MTLSWHHLDAWYNTNQYESRMKIYVIFKLIKLIYTEENFVVNTTYWFILKNISAKKKSFNFWFGIIAIQ